MNSIVNRYRQPLVRITITWMAFLCVIGCDHAYKYQYSNAMDEVKNGLQETHLYRKWKAKELENALLNNTKNDIKRGIVYLAHYGEEREIKGVKYNLLRVYYLCGDTWVTNIRVQKNGNPLLTLPRSGITKYLIAEEEKNSRLNYVEEYWWKENEDPVKPLGVEDLYVDLVKKDGTIIGPVRILSKQDVLNSMKLFEKAFDNKSKVFKE